MISRVGPNARQLDSEIEKLTLYVGSRREVELSDIMAICTRNKTARAFALGFHAREAQRQRDKGLAAATALLETRRPWRKEKKEH